MGIKCFFVRETNRAVVYLRRYKFGSGGECPTPDTYHNAMSTVFREVPVLSAGDGTWSVAPLNTPHDHPAWPTHCACGYEFTADDEWQEFTDRLYSDGTSQWPHRALPVGAMYYADWLTQDFFWDNGVGPCLVVITPGGEWNMDQRSANCTLPDDRTHRCWCRHGEPPNITVDKVGHTCAAGAGSILQKTYHGMLQNGELSEC